MYVGSYSGLLQVWDYEAKKTIATKKFDRHLMIQCLAIDAKGHYIGETRKYLHISVSYLYLICLSLSSTLIKCILHL